ncbi:hypothetical protein ANCDUO_22986 [Ancylostoma duodenale]|uniref:Uncharacterized protein n=1 Tax=Ancylostoma duodenale TaxID=51022 RepID=A0A0C2BSW0_9BILA|nr:hypothetical protein ANCDUO_22986 [Ancylostoma duodenale]
MTPASQSLRDSLLSHLRSGRLSLTQRFVHSFARRDYTMGELALDRSLRKQAGDLNAQAGCLPSRALDPEQQVLITLKHKSQIVQIRYLDTARSFDPWES